MPLLNAAFLRHATYGQKEFGTTLKHFGTSPSHKSTTLCFCFLLSILLLSFVRFVLEFIPDVLYFRAVSVCASEQVNFLYFLAFSPARRIFFFLSCIYCNVGQWSGCSASCALGKCYHCRCYEMVVAIEKHTNHNHNHNHQS